MEFRDFHFNFDFVEYTLSEVESYLSELKQSIINFAGESNSITKPLLDYLDGVKLSLFKGRVVENHKGDLIFVDMFPSKLKNKQKKYIENLKFSIEKELINYLNEFKKNLEAKTLENDLSKDLSKINQLIGQALDDFENLIGNIYDIDSLKKINIDNNVNHQEVTDLFFSSEKYSLEKHRNRIYDLKEEYENNFKTLINNRSQYLREVDEINRLKINSSYPTNSISNYDLIENYYKDVIESRKGHFDELEIIEPKIAQYFTLIETDKILLELGMEDYSINQISRSNHPSVEEGLYFYSFDSDDNLLFYKPPYYEINNTTGTYIVFDSTIYKKNKVIKISKEEIVDFKLYGTEMMQTTTHTNNRSTEMNNNNQFVPVDYSRPSITGTFFSSLLFGSSYTILNGVGKALHHQTNILGNEIASLKKNVESVINAIDAISISSEHKIIDTSRVQLILSDKRDLQIEGISIYYDLNRIYSLKNKKMTHQVPLQSHKENLMPTNNLSDEILKLKGMLDEGIIDEKEFKQLKKAIIDKSKS